MYNNDDYSSNSGKFAEKRQEQEVDLGDDDHVDDSSIDFDSLEEIDIFNEDTDFADMEDFKADLSEDDFGDIDELGNFDFDDEDNE